MKINNFRGELTDNSAEKEALGLTCIRCALHQIVPFNKLGHAWCNSRVPGKASPTPLSTAGPLWTGPLHSAKYVEAMAAEAAEREWTGLGFDTASEGLKIDRHNRPRPLESLLEMFLAESNPALPPWFVPLRDICKHGRLRNLPPRDALIDALTARGFHACRTHLEVSTHGERKQCFVVISDNISVSSPRIFSMSVQEHNIDSFY